MRVLKFEADWCHICKAFDAIIKDSKYNHLVERIDIEKDPKGDEYISKYNIKNLPTVLILDDEGNVLDRFASTTLENFEMHVKTFINE